MRNSIVRLVAGVLAVTLFFACSLFESKQPAPKPALPQSTVVPATPEPTPTPMPHHRKRRRRKNHPGTPEATPSPLTSEETPSAAIPNPTPAANPPSSLNQIAPSAAPSPSSPARVNIGGDNPGSGRATSLIDETAANLHKADRASLTGDDASAFDQSSNLLAAARRALQQGDDLAAYGLAQKAEVLSGRFAGFGRGSQ